MILDIIFLIYSIIFLLIGIKSEKKILIIFACISALFSLSSIFADVVLSLRYIPNIRVAIYIILFAVTICIFFFSTMKIIGSIFCVIALSASCLMYNLYKDVIGVCYKSLDERTYAGIYLNFDFVRLLLLITKQNLRCLWRRIILFEDTYVGIMSSLDGIFDYEPHRREYNEEVK